MSDQQDDTIQQVPPQGSDAAALGKQIAELTKQLSATQARVKELEGSQGGLTSSNKQLTADLDKTRLDLAAAKQSLTTREGEFTTLQTEFQKLQAQTTDLTGKNTQLTKQAELFNLIAQKSEYHGLVGSFAALSQVIRPDAAPETVEGLLKAMAGDAQTKVTQALDIFKAGGSPPANHGGAPAPAGPKDKDEAWAVLQATPIHDQVNYQKALTQFTAFVAGEGTQKPA